MLQAVGCNLVGQVLAALKLPDRMSMMACQWGAMFESVFSAMDKDGSDSVEWEEMCGHFRCCQWPRYGLLTVGQRARRTGRPQ